MAVLAVDGFDCGGDGDMVVKFSGDESSALMAAGVYALLMILLVFATVALWKQVSVLLLLAMPVVYFHFQEEWDRYKRYREARKKTEE